VNFIFSQISKYPSSVSHSLACPNKKQLVHTDVMNEDKWSHMHSVFSCDIKHETHAINTNAKKTNKHSIVNTMLTGSWINHEESVLLHKENNRNCDTSLTSCKWQLNISIVTGLLLQVSNALRYGGENRSEIDDISYCKGVNFVQLVSVPCVLILKTWKKYWLNYYCNIDSNPISRKVEMEAIESNETY
jgi:hypothetical protein